MADSGGKVYLEVQSREETGKNACRRLRAAGMIPGNVYGLDRDPFMVAVSPKRIDEVLRLESGVNTIFSLGLSGEDRHREAMIKELQRDPVTERPVHVDFVRVDLTRMIHVAIPIRLVGTPEGVKTEGGIIDFVHREVQIECLPGNIPEHLDVDVEGLHINQHVSIKDLGISDDIKVLDDPEQIICVVVAPKVDEAEVAAEEAAEGEEAEAEAAKAAETDDTAAKEG